MNFICAQPDKPLFIWQLKTLIVSLITLGVKKENLIFLTLLEQGYSPSKEMQLLEKYATIYYYPERPQGRIYAASAKPYLFARFWEQYPENRDRYFMFVESDMIVYSIPNLAQNDTWYWSDASKYLETGRYEHLLGYTPTVGKAFGFHAYGRGADAMYWYKVEKESQQLYIKMNLENLPGNRWICEMRTWMWNSSVKFKNEISPELIFNDGYGPRKSRATLYHHLEKKIFPKRAYLTSSPFDADLKAHPNFCVADYLNAIRAAGSFFSS